MTIVRFALNAFAVALVLVTRLINAGVLWPIEFENHRAVRDPLLDFLRRVQRALAKVRNRWA